MARGGIRASSSLALALLLALTLPACRSTADAHADASVTAAASVDPRSISDVGRLAADIRAWLREHYGPPAVSARAQIRLVPDDPWLADARKESGLDGPASLSWRPGERDLSIGTDDPPAIVLAPCFGSYARTDALARWIFYVEWTPLLAPWLREGLAETVGARAAVALDTTKTEFDRTVDDLLPVWVRPRPPFPDVKLLAQASPREAARSFADCARVLSAATQGGDPLLVRAILEKPPSTEDEIGAFAALASANAARFPSLERVLGALEERPLASSTTALLEAATPPASLSVDDTPDAARELTSLQAKLNEHARSRDPLERRIAIYGLGRALMSEGSVSSASPAAIRPRGDPSVTVRAALDDDDPRVRTTAIVACARAGERTIAQRLLELAKDAPLEEAPGRWAPLLPVFDALTGYEEQRTELQELSLATVLGSQRTSGRRPTYLEIKRREDWLRSPRPQERPR